VLAVTLDPTVTNPDHYKVVFENERVRVLEFTDTPGVKTTPHEHPDCVLVTLSSFRRRMHAGDATHDVQLVAGRVGWLAAQQHAGENIGDTDSHVIFVELKEGAHAPTDVLGPTGPAVV
jgi:hypothetical protein